MTSFHGCSALITGASSGIGREMARQLAPQAGRLILVARRMERLQELKAELNRPGLQVDCYSVDIADEKQREDFLQQLQESGTRVNLLINNAGIGDHGLFEESDWRRVRTMLDLNIKALTHLTHALLPGLVKSGNGAILNVSSVAGMLPLPMMAVYSATKSYVTNFSDALRGELRGTGVSVTALCPGPVDTEFFEAAERPDTHETVPSPKLLKVPVERVAREGLDAVLRDRPRHIPGWRMWIIMTLATLVPLAIVRLCTAYRRNLKWNTGDSPRHQVSEVGR